MRPILHRSHPQLLARGQMITRGGRGSSCPRAGRQRAHPWQTPKQMWPARTGRHTANEDGRWNAQAQRDPLNRTIVDPKQLITTAQLDASNVPDAAARQKTSSTRPPPTPPGTASPFPLVNRRAGGT